MGWEHYQGGRGLFGVRLLILHFKSIKYSIFHIFLNLTYSLRKHIHRPEFRDTSRIFYTTQREI